MGRRQLPVLRYPEDPEEKPPELRGRRLLAILISLHGGTGAVPSLILGRHSGRPSNLPPCGVFSADKLCLAIFHEIR